MTKYSAENLSITALANNRLSGYGYDAAGNMTSDPTDGVTATYDAESRIITATKTGASATYTYNSLGDRVRKDVSGGSSTEYFYFNGEIIAEQNPATGAETNYIFFNGERVARREYPSGTVSYYFSDHLKTASVVTDASGKIKEDEDYYPWGGELPLVNNDSNHYKFTGKERDSETGLDYFGARHYGNALGRFMSVDPRNEGAEAPEPQSWNAYAYVANNPISMADPDGRDYHMFGPNGKYEGDLSEAAFRRWCRATGCRVSANGTIRNSNGDILGREVEFDGEQSSRLNNEIAFMNWFMLNQSLEMAGVGAEAGLARIGGGVLARFGTQIARNRMKGEVGEATVEAMLKVKGYKIIGRHVTLRTAKGIRYADRIVEKEGRVLAIESKTGGATRTSRQLAKDYSASAEGATIGNNGGPLQGQTMKIHTAEVHPF